ncbi:protein eva-1 homolog C-like isoform X5 [Amphibalanus amphitrite]|uniref:protein eva-1 homolog C-like isoform X5 n=1 Tax=Amphibalanus amphitrite TaxID=1232801 RepID=UPI001C900254|nr:protein eva-1 homolog C-like isoform X5 [Amphibalanus amphitrite]XP_043242170.1 protein eva-1 homolog C-like isoform X5 [Amphibalanus amphitrite]
MGTAVGLLVLWAMVATGSAQLIYRENRLALLSGTLRTFQVASCDGDQLRLSCPINTVVVIKLVHYGRLASKPGLCGHPSDMQRFNNSDCMDRSALKVVIDECGGKQECRLHTSPKAFGIDPCPGVRKFVEVLYKCRPNVFRNLVVCQGQRHQINCNDAKIAIYSASFGVTKHGSVECPQAPGVTVTDCQASFTSEKMINMCQGHSSCELNADANFFNRPCPADHNAYLKVTYTCVPKTILREKYDQEEMARRRNATEAPSVKRKVLPPDQDASSPSPSGKNNKEKFILYLTLSVTGGLLLCLLTVILRLYCQRRRARHDAKAVYLDRPTVLGFGDQLSELDSELDPGQGPGPGPGPTILSSGRLSPPYTGQMSFGSRQPAEQPSYASSGRGTLRHHHDDTNPRSLAHDLPNVYYYS